MKLESTEKEFKVYHYKQYHADHRIRWPRYVMVAGAFSIYVFLVTTAPPWSLVGCYIFFASLVPIITYAVRGHIRARRYTQDLLRANSERLIELSGETLKAELRNRYKTDNEPKWPNLVIVLGIIMLFMVWLNVSKPVSYVAIPLFVASFIPSYVTGRRANKDADKYAVKEMKK